MTDVTPAQAVEIALAHHRAGDLAEAEKIYRKVLQAQPEYPPALHWLGVIARMTKHRDDELRLIARSVELNPNDPLAQQDLGETLRDLNRLEEAESHYLAAAALAPNSAPIQNDLGVLYRLQRRHEEALAAIDRAIALAPDLSPAHGNRGSVLTDLGRLDEALLAFDQAMRLNPNILVTRLSRARAHFLAGDLKTAFELYETRLLTGDVPYPRITQPMWNGEDLAGKTLLVVAEQGIGDTIQFVRYLPILRQEHGANVLLVTSPETKSLFSSLEGIKIAISGEDAPLFDYHVPVLSIARVLGTNLETIPAQVPYLKPDPARVESWQKRLADLPGKKIGLVWAGSPKHTGDARRSMKLADFAPLGDVPGITLFSLQKGPPAGQIATPPPNLKISDLAPDLNDYSDTAAAITALDLLISVDTSVAHLAGALAKPIWTLIPYEAEWRWLLNRDDSPWYPTMRLFRQPAPGDWPPALANICAALRSGDGA